MAHRYSASGLTYQRKFRIFPTYVFIIILMLHFLSTAALASTSAPIVPIATVTTDTWEEKQFEGSIDYQAVVIDGIVALRAHSISSASGLYWEQRIDLYQTPYLNWHWRVDKILPLLDEKTRSGDDYAARIYVVIDGGLWFWRTRALSYVWSSSMEQESAWDNAFAGSKVRMLALRNNDSAASIWHVEKRNIFQDLKHHFGDEIRYIDAIAIMTDTDNSKGEAIAYYGNIFFSAQ